MDSSLAALTGQPVAFVVGDKTYQIYPLRIADFGKMQAWCDSRQPNPYASVSEQLGTGLFTVAQEKALLEAAVRVATGPKPRIGSPECDALVGSVDGIAELVRISISRGEPKFTAQNALDLISDLDDVRLAELSAALKLDMLIGGRTPEEDEADPKAPAPGGNSSTPP